MTDNPVLKLEDYQGLSLPTDYEITGVLGDIIMAGMADCDESGQMVNRGGILVNTDVQKNVWRVGKAILCGPDVKLVKPGTHFIFPNDKGIKAIRFSTGGKHIVFLNEARIFCTCEPKK